MYRDRQTATLHAGRLMLSEINLFAKQVLISDLKQLHYRRLADSWILFDNSGAIPNVIAFEKQGEVRIMEPEIYNGLVARYGKT